MSEYKDDIPKQVTQGAYNGTSFNPEKRADQTREDYAASLDADRMTFLAHAEKGGTLDILEAEFIRYRAGLSSRWIAAVRSDARCVSWFIAGPSNFPARRMQKRADVAHRRWSELFEWRDKTRAAIIRKLRPELAPIMTGDSDATERLQEKLTKAEESQERMKACNAAIRKNKKAGPAAQVAALEALGYSAGIAAKLLEPDACGRIGFPNYELTNNAAEIRRIKTRLEHVAELKATPETTREGTAATLEDCPADNRIRLTFPGKPSAEVRDQLKKNGFRWTPSLGVWQCYRGEYQMQRAKQIAGVIE